MYSPVDDVQMMEIFERQYNLRGIEPRMHFTAQGERGREGEKEGERGRDGGREGERERSNHLITNDFNSPPPPSYNCTSPLFIYHT